MTDTRWLDDDEQRAWRAFMAGSQLLFDNFDRQLQREAALPHTYYEILVRLSESPDRRLRMSELADTSLSSRSRVSHAVARLEETGWVARETCPTDKRGAFARLTDQGFAVLEAAAPGHVEVVRSLLFDALSPQQVGQLRDIFNAVLLNMVPVEPRAARLLCPGVGEGPADSGPADSGPADSGPADSGPADSGPADSGPADVASAGTSPADGAPAGADGHAVAPADRA